MKRKWIIAIASCLILLSPWLLSTEKTAAVVTNHPNQSGFNPNCG